MPNPIMKEINPKEIAKQAIGFVHSFPCSICSLEGICGVKYKGTCKVMREIRINLYKGIKGMDEEGKK